MIEPKDLNWPLRGRRLGGGHGAVSRASRGLGFFGLLTNCATVEVVSEETRSSRAAKRLRQLSTQPRARRVRPGLPVLVLASSTGGPFLRSGSRSGKPAGSVVTSLTGAGATSANRGPKAIGQKDKTLGGPTMSRTVAAIHVVGAGAGGTPVFGVCKRAFNFPNDQIHFSHDLRGRLNTG